MSHEQELIVAIVSLASVVVVLWAVVHRGYKKLEKRTEECEKDRKDLWKTVTDLSLKIGICSSCPERKK